MRAMLVFFVCVFCCAIPFTVQSKDNLDGQKSAFRRLTMAVQGELYTSTEPMDGAALLERTCENDRTLCSHFGRNRLLVTVASNEVVLLMCTVNQDKALLEDAACTPELDKLRYEEKSPCIFTISPESFCKY